MSPRYFDDEIVSKTTELMRAIAQFGKIGNEKIVPSGGSGAVQTFKPYEYIGIKSQKDLSLWRKWKTPNDVNDGVMFTTERIKYFLDYTITLNGGATSSVFEDPQKCLLMAIWLRQFRSDQVVKLFDLFERYLNLLQRGVSFTSVSESLHARKEISDPDRIIRFHPRGVRINRIEVSKSGKFIAECADDGILYLFSTETSEKLIEIEAARNGDGSRAKFYSMDISVDGSLISTASNDGKACIWEAETGKLVASFQHRDAVTDVSLSPDGRQLAVACDDFCIYTWSIQENKIDAVLRLHTGMVRSVNFSSDGKYIISSAQDQTSVLWSVEHMAARWAWGMHGGRLYDATVISKHRAVATVCTDSFVRIFCMDSGKLLASSAHHRDWVNSMAVSKDGTKILTASRDKTARIWDWKTNDQLLCIRDATQNLRAARFSHDEKKVITGGYEGALSIWEPPIEI